MNLQIKIAAFFVITSYFGSATLNCTHQDLYKVLVESTPFCVITGMHCVVYHRVSVNQTSFFHWSIITATVRTKANALYNIHNLVLCTLY